MKILNAESRVGRMLDELMRSLEQDHQEWVLHQEGKMVVEVMTMSIKSESLCTGHQLYVGLDDEPKPSPAAKSVEAPRGGKPQVSRREGGREDAAKNNGRVGGKAETIVPKNALCQEGLLEVRRHESPCGEAVTLLDVTVVTRGVMDALDAAGVKVGTVSYSVPHLSFPYGSDAKPIVMTRTVKFNC
ncbi:hypothetical protein DYB28_009379 [Aphanomyces astaci]|uniref:Uncharacterized protein n=1 Tax=Aphanomyces astaci TaxID=112090 RepID=A0A9X8H3K9_APHAT|nr:hypothetical protein DYB28_009379 [Aphanomyces astaci]